MQRTVGLGDLPRLDDAGRCRAGLQFGRLAVNVSGTELREVDFGKGMMVGVEAGAHELAGEEFELLPEGRGVADAGGFCVTGLLAALAGVRLPSARSAQFTCPRRRASLAPSATEEAVGNVGYV